MFNFNASVIRCDYVVSNEYRSFVNVMAKSGLALSKGVWWVERVDGSVGTAYHLMSNDTYYGCARKEDLSIGSTELALWDLMKYLERHSNQDCRLVVFPRNWAGTCLEGKSNEFLSVSWRGPRSNWQKFVDSFLSME